MDLTEKIKVKYSFSSKAEILDRQSEELKEYEIYFEKEILPEIKEIEKRKIKARDRAYRINVSLLKNGLNGLNELNKLNHCNVACA